MSLLARLLLVTLVESFATILVERGVYFFAHERLGFSDRLNLALAVAFGLAYLAGALSSHRLSVRLGERRVVLGAVLAQAAVHAVLAVCPTAIVVFAGSTVLGWLNGAKWPILESYVSAGRTPRQAASAVGRFSIAWAVAVPPSLAVVGPLIALHRGSLFMLAAALNVLALALLWPVPGRPVHLPHDHPERPSPDAAVRLRAMLGFSRWAMFASYASLWVLAALMPGIFSGGAARGFGLSVAAASGLSGVVDVMRLAAFVLLQRTERWHFRWWPLAACLLGLPAGFVLVLLGPNLAAVLAGEALFGLSAGLIYYAALYYAMVVQNASVDAGGAHEGLIGLGFAAGPVAGLAGSWLAPWLGGPPRGVLLGVGAIFLACGLAALRRALPRPPTAPKPAG